jgi:hypothetical protein
MELLLLFVCHWSVSGESEQCSNENRGGRGLEMGHPKAHNAYFLQTLRKGVIYSSALSWTFVLDIPIEQRNMFRLPNP